MEDKGIFTTASDKTADKGGGTKDRLGAPSIRPTSSAEGGVLFNGRYIEKSNPNNEEKTAGTESEGSSSLAIATIAESSILKNKSLYQRTPN
jgi:hypothetical protein